MALKIEKVALKKIDRAKDGKYEPLPDFFQALKAIKVGESFVTSRPSTSVTPLICSAQYLLDRQFSVYQEVNGTRVGRTA